MIERLREQGVRDERVLTAMAAVPRHVFVGEALAHRAYEDTALPLILGQTISQPYVVARMIELLLAGRETLGKTLEVGAGCGYQAAILGTLSNTVYAVERMAPLLAQARENLRLTKLSHVRLKHADGMLGLPEAAPFDTIIVAAAAPRVPRPLIDQLAPAGRLMLPVGAVDQVLCLVERGEGGLVETRFDPVRFVPLLPGVE
jgi:protein-L-isoaspartate(D-aspartate) O-methyltransferase